MSSPFADQHRKRASVHEAFAQAIESVANVETPGWQVTALYYVAVRRISAYIAETQGEDPRTHVARKALMKLDPKTQGLIPEYEVLESWSKASRYKGGGISKNNVLGAEKILAKITTALAP